MSITASDLRTLRYAEDLASALEQQQSRDWLSVTYSKWIYGGWISPDGEIIDKPNKKALAFHQACKLRFCKDCWVPIGYIGSDPAAALTCPRCNKSWLLRGPPSKRAGKYALLFASGGNRSGKSVTIASEFWSMVIGHRPWDGSLTTLDKEPGQWVYWAPKFTENFDSTIYPYMYQRVGHLIENEFKDANGQIRRVDVRTIHNTVEQVFFNSYEQSERSGTKVAGPEEARTIKGAGCDEPPTPKVLTGIMRGCMTWQRRGEGRILIAGTSIHDEHLFRMHQKSWNKGGKTKTFFTMEFESADNPAVSEEELENLRATCQTPEEEQMRLYGRFRNIAGRVFPDFDESIHGFIETDFDPLLTRKGQREGTVEPSAWPIICFWDPHDRRPSVFSWWAISPFDDYYCVRIWPNEPTRPYYEMRNHMDAPPADGSVTSYAEILAEVEAEIPGGADRVLFRYMDPKFGSQHKLGTDGQSVQEMMSECGYDFLTDFMEGPKESRLEHGHSLVRDLLRYDKTRPVGTDNRPKMRVGRLSCRDMVWAFCNYANEPDKPGKELKPAVREAGKDHMDHARWLAVLRPRYIPWNGGVEEGSMVDDLAGWRNMGLGDS